MRSTHVVAAVALTLFSLSQIQGQEALPAGGGEQPLAVVISFAEEFASGDLIGTADSATELLAMAANSVASEPKKLDDVYLTAEQIVRLYLEEYPSDLLYRYFKAGGGKVLIKALSPVGAYWSYHWKFEIHFDDSWVDNEWNRQEAVRHLRNHLLEMADEASSAINVHLTTWDGDVDKYLDKMEAAGIPLAVIFSPKQMTSSQLEGLNQAIVTTVKMVPYFGGFVMTFELASGQVLSFTVYGQRELTTTEKWIIVGTPAAGFAAGVLVKVGGKWIFRQVTDRVDDLADLTNTARKGGSTADSASKIRMRIPTRVARETIQDWVDETMEIFDGKIIDLPDVVGPNNGRTLARINFKDKIIYLFKGADVQDRVEELLHFRQAKNAGYWGTAGDIPGGVIDDWEEGVDHLFRNLGFVPK